MKLRMRFGKEGIVKFIGHLDIMRYFQKAFRRANVDITYSQGYHPHPCLSFASPLGVGLESRGEYLDMEVNSFDDLEAKKALLFTVFAICRIRRRMPCLLSQQRIMKWDFVKIWCLVMGSS